MNTPTIASAVTRAITSRLMAVNVSIPARVESFNRARQSIVAQPLVRVAYTDEAGARVVERLPAIVDVPVVYQGGGAYSSTFPLAKGDTVLLVFSQASLDKWLTRGGDVDPLDYRRHALSDAVAIPGLRPFSSALGADATAADAMVLAGPEVRIGGASGTEPTLMAEAFKSALDTLISAIATAVGTSGSPAGATASATAIGNAKTVFLAAMDAAMTTIAKVK